MAEIKRFNAKLPQDADSVPVQVVIGNRSRANFTAGAASARVALPAGTGNYILIRSTDYFWMAFGDNSITASAANTSILVPPGEGVYEVWPSATYVAGLRTTANDAVVQVEAI